jgi:hypothetical protein
VGDSRSDVVEDLPTEGEDAAGDGVEAWVDTVAIERNAERPKERSDTAGVVSLDVLRCS